MVLLLTFSHFLFIYDCKIYETSKKISSYEFLFYFETILLTNSIASVYSYALLFMLLSISDI